LISIDYGSAFVCGKSRFEEGKFHVRDDPIIEIACGDEHTGVVTGKKNSNFSFYFKYLNFKIFFLNIPLEKGRVFMFGSKNWGQLGLGHENNVDRPSCIKCELSSFAYLIL
jgi:X-linked retinitis pigmentosa GTPase regulator